MAKQAVKTKKKSDKEAYLMILPAYLIFAVFILIPIGMVLYYSLTDAACPWTFVSCFTLQEVKSSSYFQDCFVPSKRNVYGMRFYGVAVVI